MKNEKRPFITPEMTPDVKKVKNSRKINKNTLRAILGILILSLTSSCITCSNHPKQGENITISIEAENHNHELSEESDIGNNDNETEDISSNNIMEEVEAFELPYIGDYDGDDLYEALRNAGYEISEEYLLFLAQNFSIKDYTEADNPTILEILKTIKDTIDADPSIKTDNTIHHKIDNEEVCISDENHNHRFNKWNSFNDEYEFRECECGEHEYREHIYKNQNTKYIVLNNNYHSEITYSQCSRCKHIKVTVNKEEHLFNEYLPIDGTHEQATCECGYIDTRDIAHEHNWEYDHSEYIYLDNVSHQETKIYTCDGCSELNKEVSTEHCNNKKVGTKYKKVDNTHHNVITTYKCDDCGNTYDETKKINCSFKVTGTRIVNNNNGTHSILTDSKCKDCGNTKTDTKTESCTYNYQIYSETYIGNNKHEVTETAECPTCHSKDTRKRTENCDYSLVSASTPSSNNNGTHTITKEYECDDCGHRETKTTTENCNYKLVSTSNSISNGNGTHTITKQLKCDGCGYITNDRTTENCKSDGIIHYTADKSMEYNLCTECGDKINMRVHNHSYSDYHDNGENEIATCGCGETKTRAHTYGAPVYDKTTSENVYTCSTCGHEKREYVLHTHSKQTTGKVILNDGSDNCYKITSECSTCHDTFEDTYGHNMLPTGREVPADHSYCYVIVYECSEDGCNHKVYGGTVGHYYEKYDEDMFYEYYCCTECGDTKSQEKPEPDLEALLGNSDGPSNTSMVVYYKKEDLEESKKKSLKKN